MVRAGIIGVTGYTGLELVRLLGRHPRAQVTYATSLTSIGTPLKAVVPNARIAGDILVEALDPDRAVEKADFFFLCLPHGQSMETAASLFERGVMVVDLSADFRLRDPGVYARWYGEHQRPGLLAEAVYGMPEIYREQIRKARLVANPGCYPTGVILGLAPLLKGGYLQTESIIADSKSGVSGAGREPKPGLHFPEVSGNFSAYNLAGAHRHTGEIEQELGFLAGGEVKVTFSPHLLPVARGILSTIYARPSKPLDEDSIFGVYRDAYEEEPFVRVYGPKGRLPSLKDVNGTNLCAVAARVDSRTGRVIVVSGIDNLVKGASGQAIQNMNLMTGQEETAGLVYDALYP
ncbi:MAG: N-acetyl-gamma-glutamyl-phosphate reductase [Proteobacteria bacterium]|nr:N-acetyl-gamma-glutamyl-phosphate reductase [Pseudomonadota bacterium]